MPEIEKPFRKTGEAAISEARCIRAANRTVLWSVPFQSVGERQSRCNP